MPRIAILADDLTGAADAGAGFASVGLTTSIVFGEEPLDDIDVLIRSTNSRDAEVMTAEAVNRRAAQALRHLPASRRPRWVYKKIDSALRGHPREELLAVMDGLGEVKALIAPALPSEGRITVGGRQLVQDVPADRASAWALDGKSDLSAIFDGVVPVHALDLKTVRKGDEAIVHVLQSFESGLLVADAETDRDLATIARAALNSDLRVLAGSAGLARQLARALSSDSARCIYEGCVRGAGPVLIVAGSLHGATAAQVETLRASGLSIIHPAQDVLDEPTASMCATVRELTTHLSSGRSAVLSTAGLAPSRRDSAFVVSRLAHIVSATLGRCEIGGLVLTGGDVTAGILSALGASELRLTGEIRAAMPWGVLRSSTMQPVPVATKAGSFGEEDSLLACVEHLLGTGTR